MFTYRWSHSRCSRRAGFVSLGCYNVINVWCYDIAVSIEEVSGGPTAPPLTCGYPGCGRPVLRTGGPGRPAEYCDLPEHTRWRAWRERQRIRDAESQDSTVTVTKPPVSDPSSAAHGRAEELTDRIRLLVGELAGSLSGVLRELDTMTDPATVAAELEATRTDAARRIAQAQAELAKAEQRRRGAQRACESAEAAAQDAVAAAEAAEQATEAARESEQRALTDARETAARAEDDIATVRAEAQDEIAAIRRDAAELVEQGRIRAATQVEEVQRESAEALVELRAEADRELAELRQQSAEQVERAQRERDDALTRAQAAEVTAERADQAAADARADTGRLREELAETRTDITALRRAAVQQATTHQNDLAAARADAAETLRAAKEAADARLAALDEAKSQLVARAQRAEAQLDALLAERRTTPPDTGPHGQTPDPRPEAGLTG